MRVFVTGATGFVGQEILGQLQQAGYFVRVLAREHGSEASHAALSCFRHLEVEQGNVLDSDALCRALRGINVVIHLAGIISEFRENTFFNVHTRGTENLVRAACDLGIERFVHMSALGTRAEARSRYHQSKWAAEEIVRQSDLDYTIFRPSVIYGPGDKFVNVLARLTRFSPVIPLLGNPRAQLQPVPVENVALAFVRSVSEPKSIGQVYDLCGPEALTLAQVVDAICRVTRRRRLKVRVPSFMAYKQAAFLEWLYPRLFRKAAPLNRDQLLMLEEDNIGNPQPANAQFGLEPTRFAEGIARYLV